jgi:hypothetical protein
LVDTAGEVVHPVPLLSATNSSVGMVRAVKPCA